MEIKSSQFDMTDPFAQLRQRVMTAEMFLRQMPPAQRDALLDKYVAAASVPYYPAVEPPVTMVTVEVEAWDGDAPPDMPSPMVIRRPRRIVRPIPWQWRLIIAGIRLTRIMRKSAKQQMKQFNKLQRQIIRRVLPRQKAMRGARAR